MPTHVALKFASAIDRLDLRLFLGFGIVGAIAGALIVYENGTLFFYQLFMPEVVYASCGFGLIRPAELPQAVTDFLNMQSATLDCASLVAPVAPALRGFFVNVHLYLAYAVSAVWRLTSIDYRNLWPLVSLLSAAYACGCFVLLRLFFGRLPSSLGAIALTLSPITLSQIPNLRDYAKAPFFIWGFVALLIARRAETFRDTVLWAAVAGAVIGVGYGFRTDVVIVVPIGALFLAIKARPQTWVTRGSGTAAFLGAFVLFASPMFTSQTSGNFGSALMQGLSEPFRVYLDLDAAPYSFGAKYSDELTLSSIVADRSPIDPDVNRHDSDVGAFEEPSLQTVNRSASYVANWLPLFSGDLVTQAAKSSSWIIGFPALVAPDRAGVNPSGTIRSRLITTRILSRVYSLSCQPWILPACLVGFLALFWRVTTRDPREAFALFLLLGVFLTYPVIQFSIRHVFHLEFLWVMSMLALLHVPLSLHASRRDALSFVATCLGVIVLCAAVWWGSTAYQDKVLRKAFEALLEQPRTTVMVESPDTDAGDVVFNIPVPEAYRGLVQSPSDTMSIGVGAKETRMDEIRAAADRLLLTIGGENCPPGELRLSFQYAKRDSVWQPMDSAVTLDIAPDRMSSNTILLTPAFYRPTQHLSSIRVPAAQGGCLAKIERLTGRTDLPMILTAVLAPGWQDRPLHRGFGGFPLAPSLEPQ